MCKLIFSKKANNNLTKNNIFIITTIYSFLLPK